MWMQLIITSAVIFLTYIVVKVYRTFTYWKRKGVPYYEFNFWNFLKVITGNYVMVNELQKVYNRYPERKFIGATGVLNKVLYIRDPELIKQICVKNFENFTNHTSLVTEDMDPLFGKVLTSLKNQKWKDMRGILSPAFTGSKMRTMYVLIKDCAKQFSDYFLEEEKENGVVTVEMRDIFTRYANDVIATSAFGITCDSLKDKDNEFYKTGLAITAFNLAAVFKFMLYIVCPRLMKALGFTLMSKDISNFFRKIMKDTMEMREKNGIVRPDMIHLLMEAKTGHLKHDKYHDDDTGFATVQESNIGRETTTKYQLTDDDITAQALLFFIAGYSPSSTLLCFMAHELAINNDVQKKLQREIDEAFDKTDDIDYETIVKMKYLDMVTSETLRKWPPAMVTERICTSDFTMTDHNVSVVVEKGQAVMMLVYSLHHDPKYFPDPEKFDPERFSDEKKENIIPFTYMPFGQGPRNCIGSRFALLEVKVLFAYLLRKFDIVVVEKTQIPLKLAKVRTDMDAEKGFWLGLKPRIM